MTTMKPTFQAAIVLCVLAIAAHAQSQTISEQETLGGPDSHETGQGPHGHLFGTWNGLRSHLLERGVTFDFQYVRDSLGNIQSQQPDRFASWNRFRWTVDISFGQLIQQQGLYFHATALWQGGATWALIWAC